MVQNADQTGSLVTVGDDSRITNAGKTQRLPPGRTASAYQYLEGVMTFVEPGPRFLGSAKQYTKRDVCDAAVAGGVPGGQY